MSKGVKVDEPFAVPLTSIVRDETAPRSLERREARRLARTKLQAVELMLIVRYREQLSGHVLELGSLGGHLTGSLDYYAKSLTGIGVSPEAAKRCREANPNGHFLDRPIDDVDCFDNGQFDAIVAGRFAFDRLDHARRLALFGRLHRVLAPGGVLIFSSHNLAWRVSGRGPHAHVLRGPWRAPLLPLLVHNHFRLRASQFVDAENPGHAVLTDPGRRYRRLAYHVARDEQECQLFRRDFELIECVDANDTLVARTDSGQRAKELYYVAQPLAPVGR